MRYGIIANPVAGLRTIDEKNKLLKKITDFLGDAKVFGLDTKSSQELSDCVRDVAPNVETLISAGGDGTLSDVINSLNGDETTISTLPFGSGNAVVRSLGISSNPLTAAAYIHHGEEKLIDLIEFKGNKHFFFSLGLDGLILHNRESLVEKGFRGFSSYAISTVKSIITHKPFIVCGEVNNGEDSRTFYHHDIMSFIVTKIPFYGYGLYMVPQAEMSDSKLHILFMKPGLMRSAYGFMGCLFGGNRTGVYSYGQELNLRTNRPVLYQTDGTLRGERKKFKLRVLPKALRVRY